MKKSRGKRSWWNHREALFFLYIPVYLVWFFALEQVKPAKMYLISNPLDGYIPFCEYFVIPYMLWFVYLAAGIALLYRKDRNGEFVKMMMALEIGLTICLLVYTFFPNWQNLRPEVYPNDNFFTSIVKLLQQFDTPTNVCPSIHVFATIVVHISLWRSDFGMKNGWKYVSFVLSVLICLSTVFLKQHSVTDMLWAFVLNAVMYLVVYLVPDLCQRLRNRQVFGKKYQIDRQRRLW